MSTALPPFHPDGPDPHPATGSTGRPEASTTDTVDTRTGRDGRDIEAGRLLFGIVAIVLAVVAATLEVTRTTGVLATITPAQWLFGMGGLCVVLGAAGLLLRRRP